jgi:hypothetical protein
MHSRISFLKKVFCVVTSVVAVLTLTGCYEYPYYYEYYEYPYYQPPSPVPEFQNQQTQTVTINGQPVSNQLLSIAIKGEGSVYPSGGTFISGQQVTLTAIPANCWEFDHWSGDASGCSNPKYIMMDCNKNVTAVFVKNSDPPKASPDPPETEPNKPQPSPDPPDDPKLTVKNGTGSGDYATGDIVKVSAIIPNGIRFKEWTGDISSICRNDRYSPDISVVVNCDITLTATFFPKPNACITLTSVPEKGDSDQELCGKVSGVDYWQYGIAVYDRDGSEWRCNGKLISLQDDKSWSCNLCSTDSDQIVVFLVPTYIDRTLLKDCQSIPDEVSNCSAAQITQDR